MKGGIHHNDRQYNDTQHRYTQLTVRKVALSITTHSTMTPSIVISSSIGIFPSDLHSYSKRRFSGPLVSLSLRRWETPYLLSREVDRAFSCLSLWCGILFSFHPPTREGNGSHCSECLSWLDGKGEILLWLSLDLPSLGSECWEGELRNFLVDGPKIF